MVKMTIYSSLRLTFSLLVLFWGTADLTIVLETNGYTNIVVAISEDIPQPSDGGTSIVNDLTELLTETSAVLFEATSNRVYFKDIAILIPSTWTSSITAAVTPELSYQLADIRVTNEPVTSASGSLPYTLHSGKCGVAGNYITLPSEYLEDLTTNLKVQAKGLVQQWAQLRYGVFEEHGYPNDKLLPYFYRHPDGYDALTSSNNTEIKGSLEKLSGGNCEVSENGIISNQGDCRFIPTLTEQTATTSLMSFHWLDTVVGFSEENNHDRRPPHRQNRLCNSRSSAEVMANLPDFNNVAPSPGQNTVPTFRILQNMMLPVVYVAMDTSTPSNPSNTNSQTQNILKRGLNNLFFLLTSYPEVLVAWSTFENIDSGPEGSYLKEELPPRRIEDAYDTLTDKVNNFIVSENVQSRDVSAVVRDAESRLRQYKDIGGSILYIVTSSDCVTNDTVIETDMAERLVLNNIKLVVAETGFDSSKALPRFSVLSEGSYYFKPTWDSTYFTPINTEIDNDCKTGLTTKRRIITSQKDSISVSRPWNGSFSIDETLGSNTTLALVLPEEGSFTLTLTSPTGEAVALPNEPEMNNWNYIDSTVRVIWQKIANTAVVGRWTYQVVYDATSCSSCEAEPQIHLQIGSSIRSVTSPSLPKLQPWISLTVGSGFVDLSQHPAIIQARFEYAESHLGGLAVRAEMVLDSVVQVSIPLFDTGLIDPDIANDGIYSGIFYPEVDGNYTVNLYAVHGTSGMSVKSGDRILFPDQTSYCCGSSLPTTSLNYFQITAKEVMTFEVRNVGSSGTLPQEALPTVSDIQANTYGIDENRVYTELKWTVPSNTKSQVVKYSEDDAQLLSDFDTAAEATIENGSIDEVEVGTFIVVYASAPYNEGKSVYFLVQTTGITDQKTRSHIVWTESNPPENVFTPPASSTEGASTTTQAITSPVTSSVTSSTEITSISSSTVPETSTTDSSSTEPSSSPITDSTSSTSTTPSSTPTTSSSTSSTPSSTPTTSSSTSSTPSSNSTTSTSTSSTPSSTPATSSSTSSTPSSTSTTSTSTSTTPTSTSTTSTSTSTTPTSTSTTSTSTSTTPTSTSTTSTSTSTTSTSTSTTTPSTTTPSTTTFVSNTTLDPSTSTEITTDESTGSTVDSTSSASSTTDGSGTTTVTTDTTTVSSTTTEDPNGGNGGGLTPAEIGYIVGGVVGVIVVIGGITGGVMFYQKRHSGGGNQLPPSTSYNGTGGESGAPTGRSVYSNTPYPASNSSASPTGKEINGRQIESFDQDSQNYDNIGVTFEDEDMCMTAM